MLAGPRRPITPILEQEILAHAVLSWTFGRPTAKRQRIHLTFAPTRTFTSALEPRAVTILPLGDTMPRATRTAAILTHTVWVTRPFLAQV